MNVLKRRGRFAPEYEETQKFLDLHEKSTNQLKNIHELLDPVLEELQAKYPDSLVQIAEVLTGWEQRIRDRYEVDRKLARDRARHGR